MPFLLSLLLKFVTPNSLNPQFADLPIPEFANLLISKTSIGIAQCLRLGIYDSHCRDVHDVTHGTLEVGKVDRLTQAELYGSYYLAIVGYGLDYFVGSIGRAEVGEHERVYVQTLEPSKGYWLSRSSRSRAKFTCISPSMAKSG